MQTLYNLQDISALLTSGSAVTWGNFDGVHLGHRALISRLRARAAEKKIPSVVMTFEPRPAVFFLGEKAPKAITDLDDKLALLERLGVDYALVLPFDSAFSTLSAEEFVSRILVAGLRARALILGYDMAFGQKRAGNFDFLQKMQEKYAFTVEQIPPVLVDGRAVASTRIREDLAQGHLNALPQLLGRQHSVHGLVLHGCGRGSSLLGFPTANLCPQNLLLPPNGVYACLARLENSCHAAVQTDDKPRFRGRCRDTPAPGLTGASKLRLPLAADCCQSDFVNSHSCHAAAVNLGLNPSFNNREISLEAHLLDFHEDLYERQIRLYFVEYLRQERGFNGIEELSKQIALDVRETKEIIHAARTGHDFAELYPL